MLIVEDLSALHLASYADAKGVDSAVLWHSWDGGTEVSGETQPKYQGLQH